MKEFNLVVNMELLKREELYKCNQFSKGFYTVEFKPNLTYIHDGAARVMSTIVYELVVVEGMSGTVLQEKFSIPRSHQTPVSLDCVCIEGISKDDFKRIIKEFVKSFSPEASSI